MYRKVSNEELNSAEECSYNNQPEGFDLYHEHPDENMDLNSAHIRKRKGWEQIRLKIEVIHRFKTVHCMMSNNAPEDVERFRKVRNRIKLQQSSAESIKNIPESLSVGKNVGKRLLKESARNFHLKSSGVDNFKNANKQHFFRVETEQDINVHTKAWKHARMKHSAFKTFSNITRPALKTTTNISTETVQTLEETNFQVG